MNYLQDTTVLVLGLGESGIAMARWCARFGADVRVWDSREQPANAAALAEQVPSAQWVRGPLTDAAIVGVKLVLKSPGLSPQDERIAASVSGPRTNCAAGTCSASAAAFAGCSRESQTRTWAPKRAHQRAIASPDSPRPSTRTVVSCQ